MVANSITMLSAFLRAVPKGLAGLVDEGLLVADDVGVTDRGQNTNLVESVLPFLGR